MHFDSQKLPIKPDGQLETNISNVNKKFLKSRIYRVYINNDEKMRYRFIFCFRFFPPKYHFITNLLHSIIMSRGLKDDWCKHFVFSIAKIDINYISSLHMLWSLIFALETSCYLSAGKIKKKKPPKFIAFKFFDNMVLARFCLERLLLVSFVFLMYHSFSY